MCLPDNARWKRDELWLESRNCEIDKFGFAAVNLVFLSGDSAMTEIPFSARLPPTLLRRRRWVSFNLSDFVKIWFFDGVSFTVFDFSWKKLLDYNQWPTGRISTRRQLYLVSIMNRSHGWILIFVRRWEWTWKEWSSDFISFLSWLTLIISSGHRHI